MTSLVVDASVAIKWMLALPNERLVPHAVVLHDRFVRGELEIAVPDLFWSEVANVVWKSIRAQSISRADGQVALRVLAEADLLTVRCLGFAQSALEIALKYGRSAYDSMYVALAVQTKAELITADEKLVNALARDLPVRWLGAFV
jgi:predicted nucleic acid-binding protein